MIVVANAGPLIALAQIRCLDLLRSLFGELRIPMRNGLLALEHISENRFEMIKKPLSVYHSSSSTALAINGAIRLSPSRSR